MKKDTIEYFKSCLKLSELSKEVGIPKRTLQRYYLEQDMPVIKRPQGMAHLFDLEEVLAWLVNTGKMPGKAEVKRE